jgi:hypothetical protein
VRFTLFYRGPLKSNRGASDKQLIREALHPQIKELWEHDPLAGMKAKLLDPSRNPETPPGGSNLLFKRGGHTFGCIVSRRVFATADIRITLLRPEEPGKILVQSGDLDNRVKTLLDALTVPQQDNQIPPGWEPTEDQKPLFCLLEDDGLVSRLSVKTERWLDARAASSSEVVLLIRVKTSTTRKTFENIDFG